MEQRTPFYLVAGVVAQLWLASALYAQSPNPACAAPTKPFASNEETAWRVFIYANCPTNQQAVDARLQWETWIEQLCLYNPSGNAACQPAAAGVAKEPSKRFQRSLLEEIRTSNGVPPPSSQGCSPSGLTGRSICEEAHLNPDAANYVTANKLQNRSTQAAFAAKPGVNFPTPSVEVKADWIRYPGPCAAQGANLKGVYAEELKENGQIYCYALGGMHISSKIFPNWLWATFEPQNSYSNPERCFALGCKDPFGGVPATTPKWNPLATTKITPQLQTLMTQAKLNPILANYRLDGVQLDFGSAANPTILGNAVIEGENAGVPMTKASCISCHFNSAIEHKQGDKCDGAESFFLIGGNPVGPQAPLPASFFTRDFAWSLSFAIPASPKGCPATASSTKK